MHVTVSSCTNQISRYICRQRSRFPRNGSLLLIGQFKERNAELEWAAVSWVGALRDDPNRETNALVILWRSDWFPGQLAKHWCPFLESPETFRVFFEWHNSLCIFKTKASRGTKLSSYLNFDSLYNVWKDQLHRISESELNEWLFGPEKLSELSRNGPLDFVARSCRFNPALSLS